MPFFYNLTNITVFTCFYQETFIVSNKSLYSYGNNVYGQLGVGTNSSVLTLFQYNLTLFDSDIVSIEASPGTGSMPFSVLLTKGGSIYGAGFNQVKKK